MVVNTSGSWGWQLPLSLGFAIASMMQMNVSDRRIPSNYPQCIYIYNQKVNTLPETNSCHQKKIFFQKGNVHLRTIHFLKLCQLPGRVFPLSDSLYLPFIFVHVRPISERNQESQYYFSWGVEAPVIYIYINYSCYYMEEKLGGGFRYLCIYIYISCLFNFTHIIGGK